ncbi:MAG: glycosyl hydrolase family 18 protein [Chlamydiota bacterium]
MAGSISPSGSTPISTDSYFDLGSWQSWSLPIDWSKTPPTIDPKALNEYLDSYSQQLLNGGIKQTTLAFAQLQDLQNILSGNFQGCDSTDALYMLSKNTGGGTVNGVPVFQYMINRIQSDGVDVYLSFGGASASEDDFNFKFDQTFTPQTAANDLNQIVQEYHLKGIDFDLEDAAGKMVADNGAGNLAAFFKSLHDGSQVPISLTLMGDANQWGVQGQSFGAIFSQGYGFNQMFDGINLMLYNGQYYLDPGTQYSWGIANWVNQMASQSGLSPSQCASYLHIGFLDSINYLDPNNSGGEKYNFPPNVTTSGQAAAYILLQLQQALSQTYGSQISFGASFFWAGNANYSVSSSNNYESQFFPSSGSFFESDFTHFLQTAQKPNIENLASHPVRRKKPRPPKPYV